MAKNEEKHDTSNSNGVEEEQVDTQHTEEVPEETHASFALRRFEDEPFVADLIRNIPEISKDEVKSEVSVYRLKDILDRYQEQPQLIDAYLGGWISSLIHSVKLFAEDSTPEKKRVSDLSLAVLRLLTKLRGYKIVLKFLPHSVSDVEQSLTLIENSLANGTKDWEQLYMLLLWLSIAMQIPFDLKKLTDPVDQGTEKSIEQRVLRVCERFVVAPEKTSDAAAYLLSRFVTRPDALPLYGSHVVNFLLTTIQNADENDDSVGKPHIVTGCLRAIASIFKSGTRNQLESLAEECLPNLIKLDLLSSQFSLARMFYMKALQRLGLTFLPTKLPTWRYKRGFRSLEANIVHLGNGDSNVKNPEGISQKPYQNGVAKNDDDKEEEVEVPELIEPVIELLLRGLTDVDGFVRWSAAKGIGRISERLSKGFAEDIQNNVLQLFSYERSENAWHGGCLALAELSRRGALLPSRFSDVVPVVLRSLLYEELKGTFAVGNQVRDAACYVCWAFARTYEPKVLRDFVPDIAKNLVLVALFDRSVNCRRAASSAFQEHVGRQGTFPHGLDIIPVLDFEALGRRTNTYLKLAPLIAQFEEYTEVILDFLVEHRLAHWDASVRDLSAQCLFLLTPVAPKYVITKVVPEVLSRLGSQHLFTRHGAIIALGCVCEGLHKCGHFDEKLASTVESELINMRSAEVFRGLGHELLRQAVLDLVARVSIAQLPFYEKSNLLDHMLNLIEVNLLIENTKIQEIAVLTLQSFLETFGSSYSSDGKDSRTTIQEKAYDSLLRNLRNPSEIIRRSCVLSLSVLPMSFLKENLLGVVQAVVGACPKATHSESRWMDCRRNCCRALERIVEVIPGSSTSSGLSSVIFDFLCDCLGDYTEDKRGNVGRLVRLAALDSTKSIALRIAKTQPEVLTPERMNIVVRRLSQLFGEGIPDIRARAGQTLLQLTTTKTIPDFDMKSEIRQSFQKFAPSDIPVNGGPPSSALWLSGGNTYPVAMDLLSIPNLQFPLLFGLLSSLGCMTESTVRDSSAAFRKYYRDVIGRNHADVVALAKSLKDVIVAAMKEERLVLSALNTLKHIFAGGVFCGDLDVTEPQLLTELLDAVQHIRRSQSTPRVIALTELYAEALQFAEPVRSVALERLCVFLTHVYPRVRVVAATKLHEALITSDDLVEEDKIEAVTALLTETEWANSLEKSQEALKEMATLLHIRVRPMQLKAKQTITPTAGPK